MSDYVARTCTEVDTGRAADASAPLSHFRERSAYVLLGDPGSGKTTEFKREQAALGDAAVYMSARDFIAFSVDSHPEWRGKTLFIDGLDEVRAGVVDRRSPLDQVRSRLDQLGRPSFRISCREADWLGGNDCRSLEAVSPDSLVAVLRLDPLRDDGIAELLGTLPGSGGAQEFKRQAEQQGLSVLLGNPQTLMLLADAVAHSGEWPESRLETFEMACQKMASEQNEEHRAGAGVSSNGAVLDAAGYLSALHLIADVPGFSPALGTDTGGSVPIHSFDRLPALLAGEDCERALRTRLFAAENEYGHRPAHRHLAEFLAGRYLAKLIDKELPASRVVALMTRPTDDRVVTALRGLSAWLAAHSSSARNLLINADPVGVGLYGDIGRFSANEKKRLLESLARFATVGQLLGHEQRDGRIDGFLDNTGWAFLPLVSADTATAIRDLLVDPDPSGGTHRIVEFVLTVLTAVDSSSLHLLDDLESDTEAIVRNPEQPPFTRRLALDVWLRLVAERDSQARSALRLLGDIRTRALSDPEDDLCGTLLRHLYPAHLPPSQVWGYVLPRNNRELLGRFALFWHQDLIEQSDGDHVAALLDSLGEDRSQILSALEQAGFGDLPLELLSRGLEAWGDGLEPSRLFDRLDAPKRSQDDMHRFSEKNHHQRIKEWLEERPETQKSMFLTWIRRCEASERFEVLWPWGCNALHWSRLPGDFGHWCLDTALHLADSEPLVSEKLLQQAYRSLEDPSISDGLTLEDLQNRTKGNSRLAALLGELCSPPPPSEEQREREQALQKRREEHERSKRQQQSEWAEMVRIREAELKENQAVPQFLHTLAGVYFALFHDVDQHALPQDRIRDFLGGESELVSVVLTALRETAFRDDLPEVDRTLSLYSESRHHFLAYPVFASLDILLAGSPSRLDQLSDDQRRKILAIRYCVPDTLRHVSTAPSHDRWLYQDPDLVFDILYRCAVAALKSGDEYPPGLYDLDRVEGQAKRVNETRARLLRAFPVRAPSTQLPLLDRLLGRALRFPDRAALVSVVEKKLGAKSATDAQKVRWLIAGALLSPDHHRQALKDFIGNNDDRTRLLAEFLRNSSEGEALGPGIMAICSDPALLHDAIQTLGRLYEPLTLSSGSVTLEYHASERVYGMISQLGAMPSKEAHEALTSLADAPQLAAWHGYIQGALESQRILFGDASYVHPDIDQVQSTLSNTLPANAADLAALVKVKLHEISDRLRGDSSNLWRQFWNEDSNGIPTDPKPENSCRDVVLELLRNALPAEVDTVPEGHYAAGTRADIRVSYGGHNIPIELKKDTHPDLWTAPRNQLVSRYTTDPATSGYGIYMPIWFGREDSKPTSPPHGHRPATAEELQQRLEQDLAPEEARRISMVVLDATKPGC
ncbi:NACHT domain-containing protein [Candidatus Poriferisocius sp.]|uniref:NACHT domain-containing protein n=1 Tax=Candidatus Poriferisocius sp. TaxID=3101276 RepID=UPI003B5A7C47